METAWVTPTTSANGPTRLGLLEPAKEDVNEVCGLPAAKKNGGIVVILGNNTMWTTGNWGFPVSILRLSGHPLISLDRNEKGEIAVSAEVFNDRDDAVVVIEKNKFTISDEAFQVENPNKSTLRVTVKHKNETVLEVHYLSKYVVQILGHFHYEGKDVLATKQDGLVVNPGHIQSLNNCTGTAQTFWAF